MVTKYQTDIIAWANEQAALLRAGNLSALDIEHIAEEIEDVGKSEQRELASRMSLLLAHLLKWQFQPERRGTSWQGAIKEQRRAIAAHIKATPSLGATLDNHNWFEGVWADAIAKSIDETGLELFPENCEWSVEQILAQDFLPD
jgi:ribosomal protein L29